MGKQQKKKQYNSFQFSMNENFVENCPQQINV